MANNLAQGLNTFGQLLGQFGNAYVSDTKRQLMEAYQKLQNEKMTQDIELSRDMHKMKLQEHDMLLKRMKRSEIPLNERFGLEPEEATVGTPEAAGGEPQSEYVPPPVTPDQTRRVQMPIDPENLLNKIFAPGSTATAEDLQAIAPALGLMEKREEFKIKRKEAETNRLDKLWMFQENIGQKEADRASREQIAADMRVTQKMIAGMRMDNIQLADREIIKNAARTLPKDRVEAQKAHGTLSTIAKALDLTKNGVTGKLGEWKAWIAPYAEAIGINEKSLSDAQVFAALCRVLVGPMRQDLVGVGNTSDWENKLMEKISGKGASLEAARDLLHEWRSRAMTKISNYNNTIDGLSTIQGGEKFGQVFPKFDIGPQPGQMYNGKRIKGVDPDTKRLFLEDGSKVNY